MSLFRATGLKGGVNAEMLMPGDIMSGGESISAGALVTIGAGTLTSALIATGIIYRTGPTGAYTDTTDTAANILIALAGNANGPEVVPGTTFRLLFVNTVAFAMTLAAGVGVALGTGTTTIAASLWREYLVTVVNNSPAVSLNSVLTNASKVVTFVLPPNSTGFAVSSGGSAVQITPGMTASGTNITTGTKVASVQYGPGGMTGVTLDTNANGSGTNSITYSPSILIDGLRSGTI